MLGGGLSTLHTSPLGQKSAGGEVPEFLKRHRAELSRSDFEYMAIADGRQVGVSGRYEFKPDEAQLVVRVGGSLAQVKTGQSGGTNGGQRGDVTGFSSGSRRRLMRMIASLERDARPIFVTLTYPDVFTQEAKVWKRDMDTFGKRMARRFPDAGFLWRIEFKERKSGSSAGTVAPHFHLLVYGEGYRDLLGWVSTAWWEVVGSGNGDHLRAGTGVEKIWSWGGIMRYVGKYIAKIDDYPSGWNGRAWGVIGRVNLPWAIELIIDLTGEESVKLIRIGRKMIRAKGRSFVYGLTWIVNTERVLDYLEFISGFVVEFEPET